MNLISSLKKMSLFLKIFVIKKYMNELEKIIEIQSWNKKIFWEIFETYFEKIYKFIYLKTSDVKVAEDLTSETFISALQNINQFDASWKEANFKAWIYKIAYNKVINFYKKNESVDEITDNLELAYTIDFWQNLDNKIKIEEILSFLDTLKKNEKNIIIYRIWYDLSFKEISEILGLSVDNCKQISSRTMKKIYSNFLSILLFIFIII